MNDTTSITTRPFDIKLARLGAPYATRAGKKATILKWDCNHDVFVLAGVYGDHDEPKRWRADGGWGHSQGTFAEDLVMAPLGCIEGRPFFCGDTIIGATGLPFVAEPRDQDGTYALWRWPDSLIRTTLDTAFRDHENKKMRDARDLVVAYAVFKAMQGVVEVPIGAKEYSVEFRPHTRASIELMIDKAIAGVTQ